MSAIDLTLSARLIPINGIKSYVADLHDIAIAEMVRAEPDSVESRALAMTVLAARRLRRDLGYDRLGLMLGRRKPETIEKLHRLAISLGVVNAAFRSDLDEVCTYFREKAS